MGQNSSRVQIANAFPQHVYIKVSTNVVKYKKDSEQITTTLKADLSDRLGKIEGEFNHCSETESQAEYHTLHQVGFSILPKGEVSPYTPPTIACDTDAIFVTVFYLTEDGLPEILHDNKTLEKKTSWIITRQGGLIESHQSKPWVGKIDEINYEDEKCDVCSSIKGICKVCYVDTKMSKIQESIGTIQGCQLGNSLVELLADMHAQDKCNKDEKVMQMVKDIEKLAQKYWSLETKTKRVVRTIQRYGENLKQAAEDFEEDGILSDFLQEARDLENVKASLKDVHEKHGEIKMDVEMILQKATKDAEFFSDRKKQSSEVYSAAEKVFGLSSFNKETLKFSPTDHGALVSVLLPVFLVFHNYNEGKIKEFDLLEQQFKDIANQMTMVANHLVQIEESLGDIETKLNNGIHDEKNLVRVKDEMKRKKMALRAKKSAEELVEACRTYFKLAKKREVMMS